MTAPKIRRARTPVASPSQKNISLNVRRLEQLQILAERENLKISQWIEKRIGDEWERACSGEPPPGFKIGLVETAEGRGVSLSLDIPRREDEAFPFVVMPDVAMRLAYGLISLTLSEIGGFKGVVGEFDGNPLRVSIRQKGTGIIWETYVMEVPEGQTREAVRHFNYFSLTPALASDIGHCIERVAKEAMGIVSEESRGADDVRPANGEGASPPVDRGPDWGTW